MNNKQGTQQAARVSDEAVKAKTGKAWGEWFVILDSAGAREMSHAEMARYLRDKQGVSAWWWCMMVANTYEQHSGLREKHQMPEGYQISVSKTIGVPLAVLYQSWSDESIRRRWLLYKAFTIRKATNGKSIRITWGDGNTNVEVLFNPKGDSKCQLVVQHNKLADADQAEAMKLYWREALSRLQDVVAPSRSVRPGG